MKHPYAFPALQNLIPRLDNLGDSPARAKVRAGLKHLEKEASLLVNFRGDPDRSDDFNLRTKNNLAESLRKQSTKTHAELGALIQGYRTEQQIGRMQAAKLKADVYAQETRQVFRTLDPTARLEFLNSAIKGRDAAAIAAITDCPPLLSGISAEMQTRYRDSYLEAVCGPSLENDISEIEMIVKQSLAMVDLIAEPANSPIAVEKKTDETAEMKIERSDPAADAVAQSQEASALPPETVAAMKSFAEATGKQ